jgi:hydroxymethylbilane synthase
VKASLRIGTRGSRLALAQAGWVQRQIEQAHPDLSAELITIRTSGDRFLDRPLSEIGGKGLFIKEIEEALVAGSIDCAVHSLKDLPAELAPGMIVAAVPRREDPRDVVLSRAEGGLEALPAGAVVGTSSLRRSALVRAWRSDLNVVGLRGNVDTRLRKLEDGEVDAIVLAGAGLRRLGIDHPHAVPCDPTDFIPAIGQGSLALESRPDEVGERLRAIEDADSRGASDAERALLVTVAGSCVTPLAAYATIDADILTLRALIAQPDGKRVVRGHEVGKAVDAVRIGRVLGERLLAEGGAEILRTLGARS